MCIQSSNVRLYFELSPYLFFCNPHILFDISKYGVFYVIPGVTSSDATTAQLGT